MTLPPSGDGAPVPSRRWIAAFLLLAMPLCLYFALAVPLGEVADEPTHLMRTASLLDGRIIGHRETIVLPSGASAIAAGVRVDPVWEQLSRVRLPANVALTVPPPDAAIGAGPWRTDGDFFPLYTIATYFPTFYLPAAAGLGIGHALDLSARGSARLGRLANVLVYGMLGYAALAVARRGRGLLFCVLAVPMSLSLAASFNQDGLIIATAVLAAALLTTGPDGPVTRGRYAIAALLLALILLAKPPYAPLALMLLLPLQLVSWRRTLAGLAPRAGIVALVVLPAVLWTGYVSATVATPVPRNAYEAGPLWTGDRPAVFTGTDPAAQLHVLLAKPLRFVTVPFKFLLTLKHMTILGQGAIGIFGWLDRYLPRPIYGVWALALVGAFATGGSGPRRGREIALLAAAAALTVWLVVLSQYLSWTNVGEDGLYGPQGRYVLPILPIFALVLARAGNCSRTKIGTFAQALPIAVAAIDLAVIPYLATAG